MVNTVRSTPSGKVPEQVADEIQHNALPMVLDLSARAVQIMKSPNEDEAIKLAEILAIELGSMTKSEREALFVVALCEKDPTQKGKEDPSQLFEYLIATYFKPPGSELCKRLIECNLFNACLDNFTAVPLDLHIKLAQACLENRGERRLASSLSDFENLDAEIGKTLIQRGYVKEVVQNQNSFKDLDTHEILASIFEYGNKTVNRGKHFQNEVANIATQVITSIGSPEEGSQLLAELIKKDPTHPLIWKIIDPKRIERWGVVVMDAILGQGELNADQKYQLKDKLTAFEILPTRIAETFVQDYNLAEVVAKHPSQFSCLTEDVALSLINHSYIAPVLDNPDAFGGPTNTLAEAIIAKWGTRALAMNLESWSGLSSEIASHLITDSVNVVLNARFILANLKSFVPLGQEYAMKLARLGLPDLINHLSEFQNLDLRVLAKEMIANFKQEEGFCYFLNNREKFPNVSDQDIIEWMITPKSSVDKSVSTEVLDLLLKTIDHDNHELLAIQLINNDQAKDFLGRYKDFQNINYAYISHLLLDDNITSDLQAVAKQIDFFPDEQHQAIALQLIRYNHGITLLENLDSFQSLNKQEIFDLMLDPVKHLPDWKYPEAVAKNLYKFLELDHNQIVDKYLQTERSAALYGYISLLKDLSLETSHLLIISGRADVVCSAPQSFPELDQRELVFNLIKKGDGRAVLSNLANLDQVSFSEILEKVFESYQQAVDSSAVPSWEAYQITNFRDYPRLVSLVLNESNRLPGKYALAYCTNSPEVIFKTHQFIDDFPTDEVVKKMARENRATLLFSDSCPFKDFTIDQEFVDLILQGHEPNLFFTYARFIQFYTDDNFVKVTDAGLLYKIIMNRSYFPDLTDERLLEIALDRGKGQTVLQDLEYFSSIPVAFTKRFAISEANFYEHLKDNESKFGVDLLKEQASKLGIRLADYLLVEDLCLNKDKLQEEDYQKIYQHLSETSSSWAEEVSLPFKEAADQFGYRVMFAYINRTDISHHDACFALVDIKNLLNKVNQDAGYQLSNKQLGNLLLQVSQDDATYPEGTALHHFNSIANRGLEGPQTLKQKVLADVDLARYDNLQERLDTFASRSQTLASWRELKVYSEWNQLIVHQAPSLKKVSQLREAGQAKLADYFERIAFYPGSKVNCEALFEFVEDPKTFLARSDIHAPVQLHNDKKPSNYLAIPHLGLTAEEVRDALVEGKLDRIQVLPASETIYSFANPGLILETDLQTLPIAELLLQTLGSRKTEVVGILPERIISQHAAAIQKVIYSAHQSEGREGGVRISDVVLEGYQPSEETVAKVREHLLEVLRAEKLIDTKPNRFLAKVHLKSSPDAVLAGDDTACCMPFGSGKNNIYMLNPNCVQFTIQQLDLEGKATRTVAQSVLTLNFDAQVPFPTLRDSFSSGDKLSEIVPESTLNHSKRVLICDSIETNKNFTAQASAIAQLKLIYEDFFKSYLEQLPEPLQDGHQVDKSQVRIGTQYAGPFASAYTLLSNTHVPLAPMSYSDNTYANSYYLTLERHLVTKEDQLTVPIVNPEEQTQQSRQVSPLTYRDCLMTAYLEGKIYSDNPSLMVSLHTIQNVLIAHDIAKVHRDQPDLSFKYQDASGKMKAYLIAYQGEHQSAEKEQAAEPCIYIYDFAAVSTNGVAGGKVLLNFLEQYQQEYLQKGNPLPIYIDARERTSYKLLMNQIASFEKRLGCKIQIEHLGEEMRGAETMKRIKITPLQALRETH